MGMCPQFKKQVSCIRVSGVERPECCPKRPCFTGNGDKRRIWNEEKPGLMSEPSLPEAQAALPPCRTHLWAMARSVKPSTGRRAKQWPRSRRSLTHSRGGKRNSSLLGGLQSWYTTCRTSSSKDRTSFSSASESPCLWGGGTGAGTRCVSCGWGVQMPRDREMWPRAQHPAHHQRVHPKGLHLDAAQQGPMPGCSHAH